MAQRKGKFSFRNLTKSQLGGVVFGCTKNTIKECMSKQLFGLPYNHNSYVQKIDIGLPLFLFNYSDRALHGIFEAAGSGQLNIDPYGWTSDGSERTSYPAQVQISVRLQCEPLSEDKFKHPKPPMNTSNTRQIFHLTPASEKKENSDESKPSENEPVVSLEVSLSSGRESDSSAAASHPSISENHPDVQNSKHIDKDYVPEKLKGLALSHGHGDNSLMKTVEEPNIPTCKNLEDRDTLQEETCSDGKKNGSSLVSSPRPHTISQVTGELRKKKAAAVMNDKTLQVITPQVTPIAKKSVTPITATPLKQTVAETEGKKSPKTVDPMKRQKGLENNSTQQEMPEKKNNKDESKKRKREHKCNSDLNETGDTCNDSKAETNDTSNNICVDDQPLSAWRTTELSSEPSPKVVKNSAVVAVAEEKQAKGTLTIFPFTKKMRFWKKYETDEVYKTMPQNPHFSPLVEVKEELREILAVGMMVRFHEALEEVEDLKLDVSSNTLSSLGSFFAHVEQHGFDVAAPQSRINKVLSLQEAKKAERQSLEKKIEIEEIKRHKIEAEVVELESKILELKEKSEAAGKMIVEMKSRAETIDQEIGHNPAL